MKTMMKLPAIALALLLFFAGTTEKAKAQQEEVSLQTFYDELSPYGTWINDPQYGYVWRPDVDQDEFRPYYTNGRWVMTEYGNTWVSNYEWGWAPFHYGRWMYNRYNQWIWIPDTVWGPAWVSWRSGGGYYGWAPLGPSISIGINIGRGGYRVPDMCWNFVPYTHIYYSSYPRYYHSRNRIYIQKTVIIQNTYVRNNRTYYIGPRADDIRRHTRQQVRVYDIQPSHRPGASRIVNNQVNIYSPRPDRSHSSNATAAPRTAVNGSVNRGYVEGRSSMNNTRPPRGEEVRVSGNSRNEVNTGRGDVMRQNMDARPSRAGQRDEVSIPSAGRSEVNAGRGDVVRQNIDVRPSRAPQRDEVSIPSAGRNEARAAESRGYPPVRSEGSERPRQAERVMVTPDRSQAPRQERSPQRMESRTERERAPQVQRTERAREQRVQQSPPQRSNSSEGRSREGSSGRPGRG